MCYYVFEVVLVDKSMLDLYLKFKEIKKRVILKVGIIGAVPQE